MSHLMRADCLQPGASAFIAGYCDAAPEVLHQMLQMGLTEGTEITLHRAAPLGDLLEFRVRGFRLVLRKNEAACLQLVPR